MYKRQVLKSIKEDDNLLFYEPLDTFYEIAHHKQKLVFLISSLRHFKNNTNHKNVIHRKIDKKISQSLETYLDGIYKQDSFSEIYVSKPSDFKTLKDLMYFCQSRDIDLHVLEDKKFITTNKDFEIWSEGKKTTVQEFYYRWLRKKFNILMTDDAKPIGGKWNLDKENRKGVSKLNVDIPKRNKFKNDELTIEVMIEVEEVFPSSFGNLENFNWAVTHNDAKKIFIDFTGVTCTNCRWMETNVFAKKSVEEIMSNFVLVSLYTDSGDNYLEKRDYQINRFKTAALPYYVILDKNDLVIGEFPGMTRDVEEFKRFLQEGLN